MFDFLKKKKTEQAGALELPTQPQADEGHCLISGNVHIDGEVQFAGTLRVDGRVDGKVSVYPGKKGTLVVSRGAYINGPIHVSNLIADGTIQGNVLIENRLECRANAIIRGEVLYGTMSLSDGAQLVGRCVQREQNTSVHLREIVGAHGLHNAVPLHGEMTFLKKARRR